MLFTTDENNVFGKSLKEAGTYNVRVTSAVATNSKSSGNPMIEFTYEVLDGQYAGAPIRYDYAVWNDDEDHFDLSVRRFNTIMIASGIPSGKAVENLPQLASVMNGRKLAVSVDWEQSQNGNWYLRVKSYHKLLQEGSQPNGKTRPESSQNSRQSSFGGNRGQALDTVSKPHKRLIMALPVRLISMLLCQAMVKHNGHNNHKHQMQMNCHSN